MLTPALRVALWILSVLAVFVVLYRASSVLSPLALALFTIAIVWPIQQRLQSVMPTILALAITVIATATVCFGVASLAVWAFSRVGHFAVADAARYQTLYARLIDWLDDHGISVAGLWAEHFNVTWLLGAAQRVTERVNSTLAFWLIALTYLILGLLEVDDFRRKIQSLDNRELAHVLLEGSAATARKFRTYMLVRTEMSAATGLAVGLFAWMTGLRSAVEWGVIAFVLNYIPFVGPFIATLFPTLLAMTQFHSWQAVLGMFIGLNIIQFVIGSYAEPRVAGSILSISPTLVLFSIFLWTFLWGFFGTFIGVPITLAILTYCEQHPSSRWVADLLGGPRQHRAKLRPHP